MKNKEKTEITRAKIFAAAIGEFGKNGYAAGSVNNICKTGINKGLIYHNFRDKDELYLECVKKSCEDLIAFVTLNKGEESFVDYMSARMKFFREYEQEAYIFLEARTNPPQHLLSRIQNIFSELDKLNMAICEKELSRHELREGVSKEEALNFFSEIQKLYNFNFLSELNDEITLSHKFALHEANIRKTFDLVLYGIAKGENKEFY